MTSRSARNRSPASARTRWTGSPAFSETGVWRGVGSGWQKLWPRYREEGVSFEWHEFLLTREFDWASSFHPGGTEICLNLEGRGWVASDDARVDYGPATGGSYYQGAPPLRAGRQPGQRHRFLTIEYSPLFLQARLGKETDLLHEITRSAVSGEARSGVSPVEPLSERHHQVISSLRHPPVYAPAQRAWFEAKALELAALFLYQPPAGQELFCHRQDRLAQERVDRVVALLRQHLAEPLSLEELGKRVGCSSFYLSRTFSKLTRTTIPLYLRRLRMERAAELLRAGNCNVTEAALEVGYSRLSHFSQAFHETFGCCPGLYPLKTPTQRSATAIHR
jgi:AraC-like DNA-binding protein